MGNNYETPRLGNVRAVFVKTKDGNRSATLAMPVEGKNPPLIVGLHGGLSSPNIFGLQSNILRACNYGFAVLLPYGSGLTAKQLTWNAGTCCGYAKRRAVDDVQFIYRLLDHLTPEIDRSRVYLAGFSNGAMLAYRLACVIGEQFAGMACVSGSMPTDVKPVAPVPLLAVHGRKDRHCPLLGGRGADALETVNHAPFGQTVVSWVANNGCDPQDYGGISARGVEHGYWPGQHPVETYILTEGGHTWPGGVDVSAHLGTGKLVREVDATGLIINFFKGLRTKP